MAETKYLHLLILCALFTQGIIGTFANDDIKESLDTLSRQKRVISRTLGQDQSVPIYNAPHVVGVRHNNKIHCVGSILAHHIVITAAQCTQYPPSQYKILSGSARADRGNQNNVTHIEIHYGNHPRRPVDGIALLVVEPAFVFTRFTNSIQLHSGPLLEGKVGTVYGWGFNRRYDREDRGTNIPTYLRSIQVPIISHRACVERYRIYHTISEMDVCTYHSERHCGHTDFGAGLVVDGYLAGVFLWSGPDVNDINPAFPDVYAILQHSVYSRWIRAVL